MRKIKLIDLLNMKAKGEKLPNEIIVKPCRFSGDVWHLHYDEKFGDYKDENWNRLSDMIRGDLSNLNEKIEIIEEDILDDEEKEYLSAVIRPFRNKVKDVVKYEYGAKDYIVIEIKGIDETSLIFPTFKADTMYKGMKLDKKYTLEELGL